MLPNKGDDGVNDPDPRIHQLYGGKSRLDRLRRLESKLRRPNRDSNLLCCDYEKKEAAVYTAIKGEGNFYDSQLCTKCLRGEYLPRVADLDDNNDDNADNREGV